MAFELFGFSFNKKSNEVTSTGEGLSGGSPSTLSFAAPDNFDGTNVLETGGFMSSVYDFGGSFLNENSLIHQYRSMSLYPEVDMAIEDIVTESIVFDSDGVAVKLNLDNVDLSDNIKSKVYNEFEDIMKMLGNSYSKMLLQLKIPCYHFSVDNFKFNRYNM